MRSRFLLVVSLLMPIVALPGCGGSSSTPPPPQVVTISVTASQPLVPVQTASVIVATVHGSSNHAVTWEVNGVTGGDDISGHIDSSGNYLAPLTIPTPSSVIITAIAQADTTKSASASVIVTPLITPPVTTRLIQGGSQQYTLYGTAGGVNWTVSCVSPCDSSKVGTISTSGFYTAPDAIPDNLLTDPSLEGVVDASPVTVRATLQSDPASVGSAIIYLNAGGPIVNVSGQPTPVALGTSGGNVNDVTSQFCCSGTLGSLVIRNGSSFVLSNNHVLARSGKASNGEPISQPGLVDSNCTPQLEVANLSQQVPLPHNGTAAADAAIAEVVFDGSDSRVDISGKILQLGTVTGGLAQPGPPASDPEVPTVNLSVAKSGRTTGLSCSTVTAVNGTFTVRYETTCGSNSTFLVSYTNQVDIVSNTFSAPGDSGSLIVDAETAQPVALLYAGSGTDTIANPIQAVLAALPDNPSPPQQFPTFVGGSHRPVPACAGLGPNAQKLAQSRPTDAQITRATAVKEKHVTDLMHQPGVIGVAVGAGDAAGEAAIIVYLDKDKKHGAMPASLDGVKVKVRSVKHFKAYERLVCPPAKAAPQLVELRDHVLKPCH